MAAGVRTDSRGAHWRKLRNSTGQLGLFSIKEPRPDHLASHHGLNLDRKDRYSIESSHMPTWVRGDVHMLRSILLRGSIAPDHENSEGSFPRALKVVRASKVV